MSVTLDTVHTFAPLCSTATFYPRLFSTFTTLRVSDTKWSEYFHIASEIVNNDDHSIFMSLCGDHLESDAQKRTMIFLSLSSVPPTFL